MLCDTVYMYMVCGCILYMYHTIPTMNKVCVCDYFHLYILQFPKEHLIYMHNIIICQGGDCAKITSDNCISICTTTHTHTHTLIAYQLGERERGPHTHTKRGRGRERREGGRKEGQSCICTHIALSLISFGN